MAEGRLERQSRKIYNYTSGSTVVLVMLLLPLTMRPSWHRPTRTSLPTREGTCAITHVRKG